MRKITPLLFLRMIIACGLLLAMPALAPADPDWKEFVVPDFGTRLEYPAGIFSVSQGRPEIGEGGRLSTADNRASLTIYSRANEASETPATYLRKHLKLAQSGVQYKRVTPSFFAISTASDDTIYYSRCNFTYRGAAGIHCFDLVYPQREKRAWDAIVTRISLSLRPLRG